MGSNRSRSASTRPSFDRKEWREAGPALALLGVVVAVFALTAVLHVRDGSAVAPPPLESNVPSRARNDAPRAAAVAVPRPETPADDEPGTAPASVAEAVPAPSQPPVDDLEARTVADRTRLARYPDGWTLQLGVLCNRDSVRNLIARTADRPELHVLPKDHHGTACYRLCWGVYATRDAALAAGGIPPGLRSELGPPSPAEIAVVTP